MINSLLEEKECCLSFSNFRTKQNVQKRKLGVELVKREWKVCSSGFGDGTLFTDNKSKRRNVSKFVVEATPHRNFDKGHKSKITSDPERTDPLSSEAKPITPKAYHQSLKNLDDSSTEENTLKQRNDSSKCSSSVFLEVQNIQDSFQRSKLDGYHKTLVKLPSEFTEKFKAELRSKRIIQKSNQSPNGFEVKSHSHPAPKFTTVTFDPTVRNHEELENKHKFQDYVHVDKVNSHFKSSKIALWDFKINADSSSTVADSAADTQSSIINNKCMKVTAFTQKLKANLSSKGRKLQSPQSSHFQNGNPLPQIKPNSKLSFSLIGALKTDQQLQNFVELENKCNGVQQKENVKSSQITLFDLTSKPADNLQSIPESFLDEKSVKVFTEYSKKFTTDLISKKKPVKQDVFKNSFGESKFSVDSPVNLPSKFAKQFKTGLLPKKIKEQENVPKKLKMDQSTFIVSSADFSQSNDASKVKRINLPTTFPISSEHTVVSKKTPNEFSMSATNLEASLATTPCIQFINFDLDSEKSFQTSSNRNISSVEISKLLNTKSVGSKGSNWMQSLKPEENEANDHENPVLKKKIRNIVHGGLAEQLLKLQRRESTEKAIWNHKFHQNNRKALKTSLCFVLTSTSFVEELVITKASLASQEEPDLTSLQHSKVNLSNQDDFKDFKIVFILFKRKAFSRMGLKVKDSFRLHQPWQTLRIQSIPYPIILCAYFVDVISRYCPDISNEVVATENVPSISSTCESASLLKRKVQPEDATHGDMLFYKREELVTFSARIQRVWKKEFLKTTSCPAFTSKYIRYSVLLQIKEGTFHELRLLPEVLPCHWYDVISQGEGKCFRFHNLCVTHRITLKRDKRLHKILEAIHQQIGNKLMQDFCYQLMFDNGSSRIPEEISENGFPDYCPITIEPLQLGLKKGTQERFTCIGKVLLRHKNIFYVSDESLLQSPSLKNYTQLYFLTKSECTSSLVGSTVLIKEALLEEDGLLIDNYAQLTPLCESSFAYQRLSSENKVKVKLQADVCLKNAISFLHIGTELSDIVCIQGEIESVDENTAFTWLQCSFCLQENLVQDSNLVIYCEDCSKIVPNPILNVKLEVAVHCQMLPSTKVHIQLLSTTVKRILQIPEGTCQPQCSVSDILGREIGPLYCYVQNSDVASDKSIFYLTEVDTN